MRVFVTGASGWIGSAVVPELIGAGHQVIGLARSDTSAAALTAAGVEVYRGTLDDLDGLRKAAAASDAVIHLAFKHDIAFSGGFQGAADADRRAVETFGEALAGSDRPLLIASGTLGLAAGPRGDRRGRARSRPGCRRLGRGPADPVGHRRADALPRRPRRPLVRRAAPSDRCTAKATTGSWPPWSASPATRASPATSATGPTAGPPCTGSMPHTSSGLALEKAPAGSTLHAIADEGVPIRADRRGDRTPPRPPGPSVSPEDAAEHFAWLAGFLAADSPASSALTRELLGWQPTQPGADRGPRQGPLLRQALGMTP